MPKGRTVPALLLLILTISSSGVRCHAVENFTIELRSAGEPASQIAAVLSEFIGREISLGHQLLNEGLAQEPLFLYVHSSTPGQALQALSHSLDCWWHSNEKGFVLDRNSHLDQKDLSSVKTYSTQLPQHRHIETAIQQFMEPWLGADHGLAYHIPLQRWTATFDSAGHGHLEAVLTAIERPEPFIPALVTPPLGYPANAVFTNDFTITTTQELLDKLAEVLDAVAIVGTPFENELTIHAGPIDTLPLQLEAFGISARFINGVLCIGGTPQQGQHPGERARLVSIPVSHLGNETTIAALFATWCRPSHHPWWNQPGATYYHVADGGVVVAQVDRDALATLLADIERYERREVRP